MLMSSLGTYAATLAELEFHLGVERDGLQLTVSGLSHKLFLLVEAIFDEFKQSVGRSWRRFEDVRAKHLSKLKSLYVEQPVLFECLSSRVRKSW